MSVRLPTGQVTVLLDDEPVRRRLLAMLDTDTARCPRGEAATVHRLRVAAQASVSARIAAITEARRASIVLVDRITDGLTATQRRRVLAALRPLAAAGPAVLVDDADVVAALAVADGSLRACPRRGIVLESIDDASGEAVEALYRAS